MQFAIVVLMKLKPLKETLGIFAKFGVCINQDVVINRQHMVIFIHLKLWSAVGDTTSII